MKRVLLSSLDHCILYPQSQLLLLIKQFYIVYDHHSIAMYLLSLEWIFQIFNRNSMRLIQYLITLNQCFVQLDPKLYLYTYHRKSGQVAFRENNLLTFKPHSSYGAALLGFIPIRSQPYSVIIIPCWCLFFPCVTAFFLFCFARCFVAWHQ